MIYKNVNGTQKLVTNIRKPKKWRRFEYLESSGTLYIDTEISLNTTDKFEFICDFIYTDQDKVSTTFFGTLSYTTGFMCMYHYTSNNLFTLYVKGLMLGFTNLTVTAGTRLQTYLELNIPNKSYSLTINNNSTNGTYTNLITDTTSHITFFFGSNYTKYKTKCYSFKVKINNTLVRDYIPCEYNGQYGMWDLVEDKFYGNKGTGTFTVGPEIPNYDEIEKLMVPSTLLPSGVELYEYIENDGSSYIDTGIKDIINCEFGIVVQLLELYDDFPTILGANDTSSTYKVIFGYGATSGMFYSQTGGNSGWTRFIARDLSKHTMIAKIFTDNAEFIIDDVSYTANYTNTSSLNKSLYLFARNYYNGTTISNTRQRVFSLYVKYNNLLIHNFLPCTYFGKPGMWDTVTKLFYRNLGTGEFILGNKIVLLDHEYLENTTNAYINLQYIPTNNTGIKIETSPSRVASVQVVLGRGFSANNTRWWINFTSNNNLSLGWNSTYVPGTYLSDTWYKIEYNYLNSRGCVLNDVSNTYNYPTLKLTSDPIGLFANYSSPSSTVFRGKVKYVQITEGNKIVKNFVPCSCNGTPGMWDKIECKFYESANSNTFTLGRKLSGEIPIWVLKNALIKSSNNGVYDYIDTGINNYTMNSIRCVCEMTPLNEEDTAFFGSRGSYYMFYKVSGNYFWPTSKCETIQGTLVVGHKYLVDWNKGTLTVTGEDGVYERGVRSSTANNTQNLYIFTHNPRDARTAEAKIHWFKIYIDDILVRDYVPATMGGRPGLYDKVNHKMYFNANSSGNFTVE